MSRKKMVRNVLGSLLLVSIIFWARSCYPPSQRSVVRRFERNREAFERLVAMLAEDTDIAAISPFGVTGALGGARKVAEQAGMSAQRYEEYLRLLRKAGAGNVRRHEEQILFPVGRSGFGSHGWVLLIVYQKTPPKHIVTHLGDTRASAGLSSDDGSYCRIVNNWYMRIIW